MVVIILGLLNEQIQRRHCGLIVCLSLTKILDERNYKHSQLAESCLTTTPRKHCLKSSIKARAKVAECTSTNNNKQSRNTLDAASLSVFYTH